MRPPDEDEADVWVRDLRKHPWGSGLGCRIQGSGFRV
jgi:hypothetical protein